MWYIPSSNIKNDQITNEGTITITFNKTAMSGSIDCTKTTTIGAAGYATYSNTEMFTVSGAEKIYVVSTSAKNSVSLTAMDASTIFPESTGILIKGSGSITINAVNAGSSPSTIGTNLLVGSGNNDLTVSDASNAYVFSWDGNNANSVGFYKADGAGTIAAHKAYLNVPSTSRDFLSFDFGETTGVNELDAVQNDGIVYNLQGVRQSKLQKGLNIVNGKKIIIK